MDLSDKIKELERQLELQKAYSSVQVSFGRGNKFSDEIKDKITKEIQDQCANLAKGIESPDSGPVKASLAGFSDAEVEALKMLAQAALSRSKTSKQPKSLTEAAAVAKSKEEPLMVTVLTTENVPRELRTHVSSSTDYLVVKMDDENVVIRTPKHKTILLPKQDVEIVKPETP